MWSFHLLQSCPTLNRPLLTMNGLNPPIDLETALNPSAGQHLNPPVPTVVFGGNSNNSIDPLDGALSHSPPNPLGRSGLPNFCINKLCCHLPQLVSDPVATTPSCNADSPAPLQTSTVEGCMPSNLGRHGSQSELWKLHSLHRSVLESSLLRLTASHFMFHRSQFCTVVIATDSRNPHLSIPFDAATNSSAAARECDGN